MTRNTLTALLAAFVLAVPCAAADSASTWKTDIANQLQGSRPRLEARYADATRTALAVEAENYRLVIDLAKPGGHRVSSLTVNTTGRPLEIAADGGIHLELTDAAGVTYSSLNSKNSSRVNIYRRGPYYIETRWMDVELVDGKGSAAPIKGEVVFYSYPEKFHVQAIMHVTEDIQVKSARVNADVKGRNWLAPIGLLWTNVPPYIRQFPAVDPGTAAFLYPARDRVDYVRFESQGNDTRISNFIYADARHSRKPAEWKKGSKHSVCFEVLPVKADGKENDRIEQELIPILNSNAKAHEGMYLGYDAFRGCYTIQTDSIGGFNEHFKNPNAYERATFSITNGPSPRKIYVLHETRRNRGTVECGVVLDEQGCKLPITVQISKNFSGENEEPFYNPGDPAFSETFFPLHLAPNETRKLTSLHLYQNWGNHPLKQFSSLAAWVDFYHMSTGVTETTCYVPFNHSGQPGVSIADFRAMSQKFWESQPQHNNAAGHSFLRYQDPSGTWHYVEYTGTEFRSTGPNWADMSIGYLSDDGRARVKIDVFELPQLDELRNFVRMRVDFLKDIEIKDGDLARNCQLLNITSRVQGMRYTHLAYGGPEGEPTVVPIKLNNDFTVAGAPLPKRHAYAVVYPDVRGANADIIRDSRGRIGGREASLGVALTGWEIDDQWHNPGDTILMLVPVTDAKQIKAGDFVEIDMFFMSYGEGDQTPEPVKKAVYDYSLNAPRLTNVALGKKVADFPTRVSLDASGRAEFSVAGGFDVIPIIVEGAKDRCNLRLYELVDGKKTLVEHSQPGEKDGYQVFARPDGTFGYVFLFKTDGKEHRFVAE